MFDITIQLVGEQEEINNVDKISWKNHSWKQLSLIGNKAVINLQSAKVYVFSDSVLCLGKILQHPDSNEAWKNRIAGVKAEKATKTITESMESGLNLSEKSSQDSLRCRKHVSDFQCCDSIIQRSNQKQRTWKTVTDQIRRSTRNFHRKNSLYVDVQRHFL